MFLKIEVEVHEYALWRALGHSVERSEIADHSNARDELGFIRAKLDYKKEAGDWNLSRPHFSPQHWWTRKATRAALEDRQAKLQNLIVRVWVKVEAARKAADKYRLTSIPIATGRSYHSLTVTGEGVYGVGYTCCDDRRFGCAYLGTCTAKPPRSGLVAKKI